MLKPLVNRRIAGKLLAEQLAVYHNQPQVLVLALPRGGVPVGFEIAQTLVLPLDVCLVRKLGTPQSKELAMGAIALGGVKIINEELIEQLKISKTEIEAVVIEEQKELERRDRLYRGDKPFPEIKNHHIILVDDGIATGSTIKAAIMTLQPRQPQSIILATPLVSPAISRKLEPHVEQIVALMQPSSLSSISLWYENFEQTTDEEVCQLLREARKFVGFS